MSHLVRHDRHFVIATEIEFYLFGSAGQEVAPFWEKLRGRCEAAHISVFKCEQERGHEQYEISLTHSHDVQKIITDTEQLKVIVSEMATTFGWRASFEAKPLSDDHGSGLHVHVHLEDATGKNLYVKYDDFISDELKFSIGGLLARIPDDLAIFAPTEASRTRFVAGGNAPTTISWGANNRTCAIRLPDKPRDNKHIEHRVAGADADVGKVVHAILAAIEYGLEHKITPPLQTYGDAGLAMYGLPKIVNV